MKCPECCGDLTSIGYAGSGHTLYVCEECAKRWDIKEYDDEMDDEE